MKHTAEDVKWMRRALQLAKRGVGRTSPNPTVGSVVVKDGIEVGAGYHRGAGTAHAEVNALGAAGAQAKGATLYVTLEPCSTTGRTPPCTEAILKAGIHRVVIGCLDPNPRHEGRAVELLEKNSISVQSGVLETPCRDLNEAFFCWITRKRPFVLLKMAMTLDGKIATVHGDSQWITGPKARTRVQRLRQWADAIMVGGQTVRCDDPSLTVRTPRHWPVQPQKLVWSRRPPSDYSQQLMIFADKERPPRFCHPQTPEEWRHLLADLGRENITSLLIEGGGELASNCLRAGIVDKIDFFVAPKILGGRSSRPVVGGTNPTRLADALRLERMKVEAVGDDILITGYPASCSLD